MRRLLLNVQARRRHGVARTPKQRVNRLIVGFCLFLCVFLVVYIWTEAKIRPLIQQLASERVHHIASQSLNSAMDDALTRYSVDYNDLIVFEKDVNGAISALKTNMAGVNRLKTEVCAEVLRSIEAINSSELAIPIGSAFNNKLLAGRGPRVKVKLIPVGAVDASFENIFTTAGINQTRHQIVININVTMSVLTMAESVDMVVSSQMVVAETIIVGDVPNTYADFNSSDIFGAA